MAERILYLKAKRLVDSAIHGRRESQIPVAADIIREHADLIARNSLLHFSTLPDGSTSLTVSVSLSNPQPDLRKRAGANDIFVEPPA